MKRMSSADLSRCRVILTGASGGIGRAVAALLANHGIALLLVGRKPDVLAAMTQDLQVHGAEVSWVDADLASADGRARLCAVAATWQPTAVIHNAGTSTFGWLTQQDEDGIIQQITLNLMAPLLLNRTLLPLLEGKPAARIIHIGSVFGSLGFAGYAPYCASKFGLRGMVEALRREWADKAVVLSYLGPRATATELNSAAVVAMNTELGNAMDAPEVVADAVWAMLVDGQEERILGQPEGFFAKLNQLWPRLVDRALRGRLTVIRRYAGA